MKSGSESLGEIPRLAAGLGEGDIARRVNGGFGREKKSGSDHIQGTFSAILRKSLVAIINLLLMGCGSSHHRVPSVDVFGSYFPAWLLSLLVGIVLTIIAASAGRLMDVRLSGLPAPLLCLSLILIFSISIWFWFFAS